MSKNRPYISLIIPCRNEEKFIAQCLDSVIANDYPKDRFEILILDGMSKDGTTEIVKRYLEEYPFAKLFDNPKKIIPTAMNIGIRNAKGDIIMKIDAHSTYEKDYISKCIKYLYEYNADNVGGKLKIIPRENTLLGKSIALALSNPFGAGNAYFKIGLNEPKWVDTAPFGCYRKNVFNKIGFYNENIARSEDVLINSKIRKSGGKILLVPEIVIYNYTRSNFWDFLKHNFDNGFWITYPLKFGIALFSLRHLAPFVFVSNLIIPLVLSFFFPLFQWYFFLILGLYCLLNLYFSFTIAVHNNNFSYLFLLPIIFSFIHISYGLGSVWGLLKAIISKKFWINMRFILTK